MGFWKGKKEGDESKRTGGGASTPASPIAPLLQEAAEASQAERPQTAAPPATSPPQQPKVHSALGPGTVIQGRLSFDTPVSIDGKLNGEVVSSDTLYIGKTGVVEATIRARELIVEGKATGSFVVRERLIVKSGASLTGDVVAPLLVVAEGAVFNASCSPVEGADKPREFKGAKDPADSSLTH